MSRSSSIRLDEPSIIAEPTRFTRGFGGSRVSWSPRSERYLILTIEPRLDGRNAVMARQLDPASGSIEWLRTVLVSTELDIWEGAQAVPRESGWFILVQEYGRIRTFIIDELAVVQERETLDTGSGAVAVTPKILAIDTRTEIDIYEIGKAGEISYRETYPATNLIDAIDTESGPALLAQEHCAGICSGNLVVITADGIHPTELSHPRGSARDTAALFVSGGALHVIRTHYPAEATHVEVFRFQKNQLEKTSGTDLPPTTERVVAVSPDSGHALVLAAKGIYELALDDGRIAGVTLVEMTAAGESASIGRGSTMVLSLEFGYLLRGETLSVVADLRTKWVDDVALVPKSDDELVLLGSHDYRVLSKVDQREWQSTPRFRLATPRSNLVATEEFTAELTSRQELLIRFADGRETITSIASFPGGGSSVQKMEAAPMGRILLTYVREGRLVLLEIDLDGRPRSQRTIDFEYGIGHAVEYGPAGELGVVWLTASGHPKQGFDVTVHASLFEGTRLVIDDRELLSFRHHGTSVSDEIELVSTEVGWVTSVPWAAFEGRAVSTDARFTIFASRSGRLLDLVTAGDRLAAITEDEEVWSLDPVWLDRKCLLIAPTQPAERLDLEAVGEDLAIAWTGENSTSPHQVTFVRLLQIVSPGQLSSCQPAPSGG